MIEFIVISVVVVVVIIVVAVVVVVVVVVVVTIIIVILIIGRAAALDGETASPPDPRVRSVMNALIKVTDGKEPLTPTQEI